MPNVVRRENFADDGGERNGGDLCLSQLDFVTDCQLESEDDQGNNIKV